MYFDGGYVFIPKGCDIDVFSTTNVNKESPTFPIPFIDPDRTEGGWYYFKRGLYPDKTLGDNKKPFGGGYIFLPRNSDNGVYDSLFNIVNKLLLSLLLILRV